MKRFLRPIYWGIYKQICNFANYKPVFILGCGHSGTTLILRILAEHDDLNVLDYESDIFNTGVTRYKLINKLEKQRINNNKIYWVEKTPRHINYLGEIFDLLPNSKVIYMVRDGRDVAISMKKRFNNIDTGIERWIHDNSNGLKYINDDRVIVLKLEDFVINPKKYIYKITGHLSITYSDDLLNYHNNKFTYQNQNIEKTDGKGENHQKNRNWQVNQPIFTNTSRWENEATFDDLKKFENKDFQELLKTFNYL